MMSHCSFQAGGREPSRTSHWSRRLTRHVFWASTCLVKGGPLLTFSVKLMWEYDEETGK
jgi:hypothetical protein